MQATPTATTSAPPRYGSVIDALSNNDLRIARDMLLVEILEKTRDKNSWDCPTYVADRATQERVNSELDPAGHIT